jgi:hypothetical protein
MAWCVQQSPTPLITTALRDIYGTFGAQAACVLWFASLTGFMAPMIHKRHPMWSLLLLFPQQFLVLISAKTAWSCISAGTFADGKAYDPLFITADQNFLPVIGVFHFGLVIMVYWEGVTGWIRQRCGRA